ncbi:hypothetical protein PGT21_035409 [Puccinia graminis f. sp. tritici]|uniref:Uncharacterized protein n=1 Tax=Puccinia graminis f. sp. tritici TaxID=56615 RepID=A0A5B0RLQ0_PUCGR|nr:hypothetical protein PGT21_035409 [Puccinia graminis f. sp. tritici]KAA1126329.1 hypothetical protein PGTUg99_027249 [Puccinia graminis f. sp. tritici]
MTFILIPYSRTFSSRQTAYRHIKKYQQHFVGLTPSISGLYTQSQFIDRLTKDLFPSTQPNLKLLTTDLGILLKHLECDRNILISEKNVMTTICSLFFLSRLILMLSIVKGHHICCTYLDRICPHEPSRANGGNNGCAPVRSKPPTSCSNTGGAHRRKQSNASLELNPRLPSTVLISKHKPVRFARWNKSLLSVNGSPAVSYAPKKIPGLPNSTSAATIISSKSSELFPASSTSSSSLALDNHHLICCTYLELIKAGYQSNRPSNK